MAITGRGLSMTICGSPVHEHSRGSTQPRWHPGCDREQDYDTEEYDEYEIYEFFEFRDEGIHRPDPFPYKDWSSVRL